MGFVGLLIVVWAVAVAAWFIVSKYFKSSDLDRIKDRLSGTTKAKAAKKKAGEKAPAQVIQAIEVPKNSVAQMVVERFKLGPRLQQFIEQAGLRWLPSRFVHLTLVLFLVGCGVGWLLLPVAKPLALLLGVLAGAGPFIYVYLKRRSRLRRFE